MGSDATLHEMIQAAKQGDTMHARTEIKEGEGMEFKDRLAAYFITQAEWRDYKAGEYPDDVRNERSAAGLRALAEHVRGLPATDERLTLLAMLDPLDVDDIAPFTPGEEGGRLASRFRFHDPNEDMDGFLEAFVAACARDREDSVDDLE